MTEGHEEMTEHSCVLELKEPVRFGSETIESLTLRKPTCRDIRSLKTSGDMTLGEILDIGQKLCDRPRRVIDALCAKDALALAERVGFLLEDGL